MSSFQVTTPQLQLSSIKAGTYVNVPHTVNNISGGTRRGDFTIVPKGDTPKSWFSLKDGPTADFLAGATQQVTVVISPPANATPKDGYGFHLTVSVALSNDDDFVNGSDVSFAVTAAEEKKPFPWWIVAAAVVLIAVVGGVIWKVTSSGTPPVVVVTPSPTPPVVVVTPTGNAGNGGRPCIRNRVTGRCITLEIGPNVKIDTKMILVSPTP